MKDTSEHEKDCKCARCLAERIFMQNEPPTPQFITEHTGRIMKDGKWVLEEALSQNEPQTMFQWDSIQKSIGIKWWERILLWFFKPHYGYDWGSNGESVVVIAKRMFGKIYIVGEHRVDNLKGSK